MDPQVCAAPEDIRKETILLLIITQEYNHTVIAANRACIVQHIQIPKPSCLILLEMTSVEAVLFRLVGASALFNRTE